MCLSGYRQVHRVRSWGDPSGYRRIKMIRSGVSVWLQTSGYGLLRLVYGLPSGYRRALQAFHSA